MSGPLKILFLYISLLFCFPVQAQDSSHITVDFQDDEELFFSPREEYDKYWEDIDYFDKKYPGTEIEEDFIEDVIERHPEYTEDSSVLREDFLRKTIKVRRLYNNLKAQLQEYILKQNIPLIVPDDQYEFGTPEEYRPSPEDGKALVIKDFKKVIGYSDNPRDQEAAAAKKARDAGLPDASETAEKMKKALLQRDWKTLFSYGLFDGKSPFEDNRGLGEWQGGEQSLRARIMTSLKVVNGEKNVNGAIQISVPEKHFILLEDYRNTQPLNVKITQASNLQNFVLNYPLPQRFFLSDGESTAGYSGIVTIPFSAEVDDTAQPYKIAAEITTDVCRNESCTLAEAHPELEIAAGTDKDPESKVATFLRLIKPYYPQAERDDIRIMSFEAETPAGEDEGQVLRLEIETDETPARVDAFIENIPAGKFAAPLIRIDGRRLVIRFRSLDKNVDYIGQKLDLLIASSPETVLRQSMIVSPASLLNRENPQLNLAILWFAFIGGLALNFMPCVFPVLSLKILSFTRFGAVKPERIRRDFVYNIIGIFCSFLLIIAFLSGLKLLGYAVGWGMQFQSVGFVGFMVFVIALFLAQVMGLVNLHMPEFIQKAADSRERGEKAVQFFTGMFLVLLSTPCTAPYLGTALGFALAGTVADIAVVVSLVGLGLAFPYILVALVPELAYYVPKPGRWMMWFNFAVFFMLLLTLGWLLSLLVAQGGWGLLWHYAFFVAGIWMVLFFRKVLMNELERQENDPQTFLTISRAFNLITAAILAAVIIWGIQDARKTVAEVRKSDAVETGQVIDKKLIGELIANGNIVLLKIGANWCLTCHYNDAMLFETPSSDEMFAKYNIVPLEIDWSSYNAEVLAFMEKYGRKGLPFYVIFSARVPDGQVLPEIINERDFEQIVKNLYY